MKASGMADSTKAMDILEVNGVVYESTEMLTSSDQICCFVNPHTVTGCQPSGSLRCWWQTQR